MSFQLYIHFWRKHKILYFVFTDYEILGAISLKVNISVKKTGFRGKVCGIILLKQGVIQLLEAHFRYAVQMNMFCMSICFTIDSVFIPELFG